MGGNQTQIRGLHLSAYVKRFSWLPPRSLEEGQANSYPVRQYYGKYSDYQVTKTRKAEPVIQETRNIV